MFTKQLQYIVHNTRTLYNPITNLNYVNVNLNNYNQCFLGYIFRLFFNQMFININKIKYSLQNVLKYFSLNSKVK